MVPVRHCLGDFDNPLEGGAVGVAVFLNSGLLLSREGRAGQVVGVRKPDSMNPMEPRTHGWVKF